MLVCPTCSASFEEEAQFCPRDGSPLAAAEAPDPLIGRLLGGRYRLSQRLGQGGMGTVYRAVHTLMDKPVALKILRAELSGEAEAVARFHREARSASKLDHDHCIRVTDFGQSDDGLLFLVMELLDGESLGTVCRLGAVPPARAATIGRAIAEALQHAHDAGVIHRDLKPDNVFLARRPKRRELVKVLDFGLAKLVEQGSLAAPTLTRDGTVFGTPEYMAPEQAEGEKLDGRTDVYALGCILYQLVVGDVPFRASNFVALLSKQVTEKPIPPSKRRPGLTLDPAFEAIILRCLEKKPEARFQSGAEVAEALEVHAAADSSQMVLLPTKGEPSMPLGPRVAESPTIAAGPQAKREIDAAVAAAVDAAGQPPARGRNFIVALGSVFIAAGAAVVLLSVGRKPPSSPAAAAAPPHESPGVAAARLFATGDVDRAEKLLKAERERADSVEVQVGLADACERRGNRLGALGHLEHAARLQPRDPEPRGKLAALQLRLGLKVDACKNAREALKLDADGSHSGEARTVMTEALCATEGAR